jgi:hypothetical protein
MGWVYVLINPSMDGIYKVGMTERSPEERAKELSATTSVATPFIVIYKHRTHFPKELEYEVHKELDNTNSRISSNREFFSGDPSVAIRVIIRLANDLNLKETRAPERKENVPWALFEKEAFQYLNGEGDRLVDTLKAEELFRKAKKLGSNQASIELIKLMDGDDWLKTDKSVKTLSELREAGELEASYILLKHYDAQGLIFNSIKLAKEILSKPASLEKKIVEECVFYLAKIAITRCPHYGYETIQTEISLEESESIIQFLEPYQDELISFFNDKRNSLDKNSDHFWIKDGILKEVGIFSTLGRIFSNETLTELGYNLTKKQIREIQEDDWSEKAIEISADLLGKSKESYTGQGDNTDSNPPILIIIVVVVVMYLLGTLFW